jgi:SAM-dependent methyltransferase
MSGSEERQGIDRSTAWWGVHVARYHFALPRVKDRRTLDIACGTGYGLPILKAQASRVVGAELNFDAAREASAEAGGGTAHVVVANGCHLPFPDASFDVVTSFETLEHLEDRSRFLSELRRVLTPDGLCILSTPNANYTMPVNGKPHNPFHIYEYRPEELTAELQNHFADVELLGQALDSRFKISPFWEDQQRLPRTLLVQSRLLLWRVLNKLPVVRNPLSQVIWGHPFLPTESDYRFSASEVEAAPVLVALCRVSALT